MAALVCDLCGGKLIMGAGGIATCESCGIEHSADRMKEKVQEIKGTVRVDNSHMIENYLEMANNAYDSSNQAEAESYCNKIIEIEPTNYKAWMLKGKASGWQSTLQNSRVPEAVSAFSKAIANAPETEKDALIGEAKEEIINLSRAMISLRGDRFVKWPDDKEKAGFVSDITGILNAVTQFIQLSGESIPISDLMGPVAFLVNGSVMQAYQKVIYPEYKSDRYPYPDRDDWRKYIERIDRCTDLVNFAISLCDDDDDEDVQRYENLVFLEQKAIDSCSYDYKYQDWSEDSYGIIANAVIKDGGIIDKANDRYYFKNYELADAAKSIRRTLISNYQSKIRAIKDAKAKREAAEKAEKERIAREEAQKRFDAYWAEHAEEKVSLESEKKDLSSQISALNAWSIDQFYALNKEIAAIPGKAEIDNIEERIKKLTEEKSTLGIFKGKEKKALQEQIDQANAEKKSVQDRMDAAKKEIEAKIANVKAEIQKKVTPLQNRVSTISNELTKAR